MGWAAIIVGMVMAAEDPTPPPVFADTVEVAGSRLTEGTVPARHTLVLTRDDIAALPVTTLEDLLAMLPGVGLSRRGTLGTQADTSLRGATFEQVAVIVDGIRLNNPQTGHFHLDLPLPLEAIERLEVLLGPSSALHGPDAFGGVVAITTGAPPASSAAVSAGGHGLLGVRAATPLGGGGWVVAEAARHRGFRPGTEARASAAAFGWSGLGRHGWRWHLAGGADSTRFGAYGFYSMAFPNQWEATEGALVTASLRGPTPVGELAVRTGGRAHRDHFVLDRHRPDWYRNRHRSTTGLVQATLTGSVGALSWSAGTETEHQFLRSTGLGMHDRSRSAVFGEAAWLRGPWTVHGQVRGDHLDEIGWHVSPAAGIQVALAPGWGLTVHRGRSFRPPSFTDLYYESPTSRGNPSLRPEDAWSDELLVRGPGWHLSAFRRQSRNLIDWVRQEDGTDLATNFGRACTSGIEASVRVTPQRSRRGVHLSVAWLSSSVDVDASRSRYALSHPRVEAGLSGDVDLGRGYWAGWHWRWRSPQIGGSHAVLDVSVDRTITRAVAAMLEVTNLLDRSYQEIPGVPRPGRWVKLALRWRPDAP